MEMCSCSVVSLFETILVDKIEQKSCNTVIFRQCKSLNIKFLFIEITANNPLQLQLS